MVPLHAAFQLNEREWQSEFDKLFARFALSNPPDEFASDDELGWLQYDYLVSQYLVLSAHEGHSVPPALSGLLIRTLVKLWTTRPAWQWSHASFHGMRERIRWKLDSPTTEPAYYHAVIDPEEYVFAIAADLVFLARVTHSSHERKILLDILATAHEVYQKKVKWKADGGWLFEPGAWSSHPEYRYAGQKSKTVGMAPYPLFDVAEDVSHSLRRPLWLLSLCSAARDREERELYERLISGLHTQFLAHVLVPPTKTFPAYRLTNWMDGRNGVYRWQYASRGETWGYGPYQLSGTFTLGWWAFLASTSIANAYAEEAQAFPLSREIEAIYSPDLSDLDPDAAAVPDPIPGFRELLVRLAAKIAIGVHCQH
jgi:hypothetical protein